MKGDISPYRKEIEDFFGSKNIKVIVRSYDFVSHSAKVQQCVVGIHLGHDNEEENEAAKKQEGYYPYSTQIAHFELISMPGCCGIVISTYCWVRHNICNQGIGNFLHQLRIKIARDYGYGMMMCTDVATNTPQLKILEKNNWEKLMTFNNPRTARDINVHVLKL